MQTSKLLEILIKSLQCFPGVGPKSAQRMAFYLLQRNRNSGIRLAKILNLAMYKIRNCIDCRAFTEKKICTICADPKRKQFKQICVVENPSDIQAIEQTGQYSSRYFVLMGHLSPIDGIGPNEIGLRQFQKRIKNESIKEVIIATNPTIEGETTASYIAKICSKYGVVASRIAHGIPIGGELETIDGTTLSYSFIGRKPIKI